MKPLATALLLLALAGAPEATPARGDPTYLCLVGRPDAIPPAVDGDKRTGEIRAEIDRRSFRLLEAPAATRGR